MGKFKFTPTEVEPQSVIAIDGESKQSRPKLGTDSARIAAARARHLASVKENNLPGASYGFGYEPEYFHDGPQPETSMYDFNRLLFTLYFLGDSEL